MSCVRHVLTCPPPDPMFKGNHDAFCEVYSKGEYAPDLVRWEGDR